MATKSLCSIDGCSKSARSLGYCPAHYARHWKFGDALAGGEMRPRGAPMRWLMAHVSYTGDDCLPWPFQRNNLGYATISVGGKKRSAARLLCTEAHGEPPSSESDTAHSCGNGHLACMNPNHVSWKSRAENSEDAIQHGTTTKGERNAQSTLTREQIASIRGLKGRLMYKDIAPLFGVTPSAIGLIMRGERWGWLE